MTDERLSQILTLVDQHGFLSVKDLSKLCDVSEMTIRRDLQRLEDERRVRRTYGGAMSLRGGATLADGEAPDGAGFWVDTVDVLVATSVTPAYDKVLLDRASKRHIPIVAESLAMEGGETVVAVDNFQAAQALGRWAGEYARTAWHGQAVVLDLTFGQANTQARSRGFLAGLRSVLPDAQLALSINPQSRYETAYQLTTDALTVHPDINIVFGINDTVAWGAINAAKDLGRDPESLLVFPFGLEGNTMRDALVAGEFCKAGLAMFPEIVGPVCVEAAIAAHVRHSLPRDLVTPYAVVTRETLGHYYARGKREWEIDWAHVKRQLSIPLAIDRKKPARGESLPKRIGVIVPFVEHEWYRNLAACMQAYAGALGVGLEIVDAEKNVKSEMGRRRRAIAEAAAEQVQPGDVVLIDAGQITLYLAEELSHKQNITVITNSIPVFDLLKNYPNITLVSTGGLLRHASDSLIGPTAEGALRELRADTLFLVVTGLTLEFGLSHTNLAEVAMKQAMIRTARSVILLADHTIFGQESVVQIAPINAIHKLITDEALPPSTRLDLTKLGIQVVAVRT